MTVGLIAFFEITPKSLIKCTSKNYDDIHKLSSSNLANIHLDLDQTFLVFCVKKGRLYED